MPLLAAASGQQIATWLELTGSGFATFVIAANSHNTRDAAGNAGAALMSHVKFIGAGSEY